MAFEFSSLSNGELEHIYALPTGVHSRLNLVINEHGEIAGTDGSSNSLTSEHDRLILKLLRSQAQAVVVGANSVRTEGWHIPANGELIVISHGTLAELPPCPQPDRVRVLAYQDAIDACAEYSSWILEGGKIVATHMLADSLIDELCLTLHCEPSSTEEAALPTWISDATPDEFTLVSSITDGAILFTIWRRGNST